MAVELGVAYVSMIPDTSKFAPAMKGAFNSVDSQASSSGKNIGGLMFGAVAGVGMSLMDKAISTISNSMGAAISRVDTLNAFPKIMQNLGYSADDAQGSITKMSDKLAGLPTSLDTMAGAVQVLAPLTSSLAEATDISLALNNALIAGGKSTAEQSNAMDQYVQMLAVGKVDMQAWRTMVSAMPGQMDQLSKSLLGAGAKQTDLYAAMQDGTVTFDQFNQELLKLNSEGAPGFASFAQQAQDATGGVGTSVANLQTAITRNLADVLQQLKPQIDAVITGLTNFANAAGPVVVSIVQGIGDAFVWAGENWGWIEPLVTVVAGLALGIGVVAAALKIWAVAIAAWTTVTNAAKAAQLAFNIVMNANPIMLIITAIAALVAGLIWFFTQTELGQQVWANFTQFLTEAWTNITTFLSEAWTNIVSFFTTFGTTVSTIWSGIWQGISSFFSAIWDAIVLVVTVYIAVVSAIITAVVTTIQSVWNAVWSAISSFFTTIWNNILTAAVGFAISVQQTFTNVMNFIRQIPSSILGFFSGIGSTLINSGRSLIQGFLDGIMAGFNKAKDVVANGLSGIRALFPFSPAKEGPFSGRGWVAYSGLSIGETFTDSIVRGISDGRTDVSRALAGVQGEFSSVVGAGGVNHLS